jgi:hypothetical protein
MNIPDTATLKRSLDEFAAATNKIAAERKQMSDDNAEFAEKLKAAVKRLLPRSYQPKNTAATSSSDESFAAKLTRFAKQKAQLRKL